MTSGFAKAVRIISLAPIVACALVTAEFCCGNFTGVVQYVLAVVFLTVLPLLAYPLQRVFPRFRDKGREGQRSLAMIFAVAGYIAGCLTALISGVSGVLLVIYFTYLVSGLLVVLFNRVFKIRASGHACGVAGPVAVSICTMGPWWYFGIAFLVLVYMASIRLGRHSLSELFAGSLIPVGAMVISFIICGVLI